MDINTTKNMNTMALMNLARLMNIPDDKLDNYIITTRDKFRDYSDVRISEAIPEIVTDYDEETIMVGAILAIFMSDYYFNEYFKTKINPV